MSNDDLHEDKKVTSPEKKRQKAGLNGVRPDEYVEGEFKDMAKKDSLSQTELFQRMFWSYIRDGRQEKKDDAISFEGELGLLSKNLETIMIQFKEIGNKSQNAVISLRGNIEQIEKNRKLENETLNLRIDELTNRNTELENTNKIFNEVREGLELKILSLEGISVDKEIEYKNLLADINEKDSDIKSHGKTIGALEKENKELVSENLVILERIHQRDSKLNNLESTNVSLQNTVNSMESLRKSEISSIEARYKTEISALTNNIRKYDEEKEKELVRIQNTVNSMEALRKSEISSIEARYKTEILGLTNNINEYESEKDKDLVKIKTSLKSEYDADKKMALAEVILQLAEMKGKYAEKQGSYNELKGKFNELQRKKH